MKELLKTVLLVALPASGKSEVRHYLDSVPEERCRELYGMGRTVQLDDYPYVYFMRVVDDELQKLANKRLFFSDPTKGFSNPIDWLTLINLINEDFADLHTRPFKDYKCPSRRMFARIDRARAAAGGKPAFESLRSVTLSELGCKMEDLSNKTLDDKYAGIPDSLDGKTIVIEFARGGADKSAMPLKHPYGYQASFAALSNDILSEASALYIWVTPEQSRQKNADRADPNNPGSILNHGVPIDVLLNEYGCDDIDYLLSQSDKPDTVKIETRGNTFYMPLSRFDNRKDFTTFLRGSKESWDKEKLAAFEAEIGAAFARLVKSGD